ncbi:carcinoembryonic antigen-related cell adhesion molecule 21-like [Parambassis ranga]|uniref:Carcinoembryonic antigen-related cell adhesion molecule 21-like n=1 Tax=Parambassis ranga TaxID=210632 RepID=A0A6P7H8T0_9TELE|nr:carcinoembryonic antigen-related cell adhesion molecule 21-like [Parambassis ranga]
MRNQHNLTIKNLTEADSAEYSLTIQKNERTRKRSHFPGVTLVVTGVRVQLHPAVVTEGQTVRLTCSTSCPLTDTAYIWYFNSRPLNLSHSQNKHLLLDPVSSQHAGRYYCSVRSSKTSLSSSEETLTVRSLTGPSAAAAAAAGVCAGLLVMTPLVIFLWISRKRRTSAQPPSSDAADGTEQLNPAPVYENISAQQPQQEDLHYSRVHFFKKQTDPVYSTVQPHQPREEEHAAYAVVSFTTR